MEMLERYIYHVGKFLPSTSKSDTLNELKSIILDQLDVKLESGESKEESLIRIISELGDPRQVAYSYRNAEPLISRGLEKIMWRIMKLTSIIIPLGIFIEKTISYINSNMNVTIMDILLTWAYSIPTIITPIITCLTTIFLIFLIIERLGYGELLNNEVMFNPRNLPSIPRKIYKITLFESLINILGYVGALYVLNLNSGLIGITFEGKVYPLLNSNFNQILQLLNLSIIFILCISIYNLIKRRKDKISLTSEILYNLFCIGILYMLAAGDIFNSVIIEGYGIQFLYYVFIGVLILIGIVILAEFLRLFLNRNKL